MELLPYQSFDSFFILATKDQLDAFARRLGLFVKSNIEKIDSVDTKILIDKFESVKSEVFKSHGIVMTHLDALFYGLDTTIEIPMGYCHGDLTFSNMMFYNNEVALIDFLDTFLDSPLQDIVKVRQDTRYFWSMMLSENEQHSVRLKQVFAYIDRQFKTQFSDEEYYKKYYVPFQVLNLLRIVPYATDKVIIDMLLKEINLLCLR